MMWKLFAFSAFAISANCSKIVADRQKLAIRAVEAHEVRVVAATDKIPIDETVWSSDLPFRPPHLAPFDAKGSSAFFFRTSVLKHVFLGTQQQQEPELRRTDVDAETVISYLFTVIYDEPKRRYHCAFRGPFRKDTVALVRLDIDIPGSCEVLELLGDEGSPLHYVKIEDVLKRKATPSMVIVQSLSHRAQEQWPMIQRQLGSVGFTQNGNEDNIAKISENRISRDVAWPPERELRERRLVPVSELLRYRQQRMHRQLKKGLLPTFVIDRESQQLDIPHEMKWADYKISLDELMDLTRKVIKIAVAKHKSERVIRESEDESNANPVGAFDKLKTLLTEAMKVVGKVLEEEERFGVEDYQNIDIVRKVIKKMEPLGDKANAWLQKDPFETGVDDTESQKIPSIEEAKKQLNSTEDVVARSILEALLDYVEPGSRKDEMIAQFGVKLHGWEYIGDKEPYFKFSGPPVGELSWRTHPGVEAFDLILSRKDFRKIFFQERGRDSDFEAFRRRLRVHYPKPDDISEDEWTYVLSVLASRRCAEFIEKEQYMVKGASVPAAIGAFVEKYGKLTGAALNKYDQLTGTALEKYDQLTGAFGRKYAELAQATQGELAKVAEAARTKCDKLARCVGEVQDWCKDTYNRYNRDWERFGEHFWEYYNQPLYPRILGRKLKTKARASCRRKRAAGRTQKQSLNKVKLKSKTKRKLKPGSKAKQQR